LPFVAGALGLLIAYVLPGGLTGGQGFLVGFLGALGAILIAAYAQRVRRAALSSALADARCPSCGTRLGESVEAQSTETTGASHRASAWESRSPSVTAPRHDETRRLGGSGAKLEAESLPGIRVAAIRDAATRARSVYGVLLVASLAMFITVWNMYVAWDRSFAVKKRFEGASAPSASASPTTATGSAAAASNEVAEYLHKKTLDEWMEGTYLTIPLVGFKVSESDISFLGTFGILILCLWYFYCQRRENHLIGTTLQAMSKKTDPSFDVELRSLVVQAIHATQVFATVSENDDPISDLDPTGAVGPTKGRFWKLFGHPVRGAVGWLIFMPVVAIGFALSAELIAYWRRSPFRDSDETLGNLMNWTEQVQHWVTLALGLIFGVTAFFLCQRARAFHNATSGLLAASGKEWMTGISGRLDAVGSANEPAATEPPRSRSSEHGK